MNINIILKYRARTHLGNPLSIFLATPLVVVTQAGENTLLYVASYKSADTVNGLVFHQWLSFSKQQLESRSIAYILVLDTSTPSEEIRTGAPPQETS